MPFINDIKVATAGGADQTLYTCPAGTEAAVPTIYFNARTGAAELTLKVYRQASGLTTEILEAFPVADDAPYNFPKPVMLNAGDFISFSAATNDVVGLISVYQSGGVATTASFDPRGEYSAVATYDELDVVEESGSSYVCITDGTSGEAPSGSANFVLLVSKGDTGADGLGWTGGSYDAGTGVVTFASDDGLGFTTGDLRGADGIDGLGWTGASYDAGTGVVTFTSDDGLEFTTGDLRGADGTGSGTVTSVAVAGGTGLDSAGGPITSSGTITLDLDAATIASLALADSATQPGDLETVATTGAYSDLSGLPTLGTAAATDATDYATAAQGALADSALQSVTGTTDEVVVTGGDTISLATAVTTSLALADTATQPGDLATVATTGAYSDLSGLPTLGTAAATDATDYATAAQGALADSALQAVAGTTDEIVVTGGDTISLAAAVTTSLGLADSALQAVVGTTDEIVVTGGDTISLAAAVTTSLGLADTATQPGDLATVATTGAYSDLSGTPTLGTMAAEAAADYLAVAGDAMTGDLTVRGVLETEHASSATTYAMDPTANGTRATLTLTAATTLTDSLSDGEHISLRIIAGDTHVVTWVAGTLWVGGSAPTLTGDDRVTFEKWGTDLIGYVGLGVA